MLSRKKIKNDLSWKDRKKPVYLWSAKENSTTMSSFLEQKNPEGKVRVGEVRNIQVLRGVAALAVIFFHIRLWEGKAVGDLGISPGFFKLGEIGVDLFFVISGFIMAYIQPAPLNRWKLYARFIIHRATRIYPPLWIVMTPLLPIYLMHPELFNNFYNNRVELLRSFLLFPQDYTPLLGVAWTLIHEVYFYIVVSGALVFSARGRLGYAVCWFLLVVIVFSKYGETNFGYHRVLQLVFSPFSLTFLLGFFLGLWYSHHQSDTISFGLVFSVLAVLGLVFAWRHELPESVYPNNNSMSRFLVYGVPCALLVAAAVFLERRMQRRFETFRHLGNESYAIYLLHLPILTIVYKSLKIVPHTTHLILAVAMLVSLVGCISVAAVFHRYIEVPVTTTARKYLERRFGVLGPQKSKGNED